MNAKWISVDKLPTNSIEHLVIKSNGNIRVAWHGSNNNWYDGDWGDMVLDVTHWMALPEPPESE